MTEEGRSGENDASLRIANQFVEFANNMLDAETHPIAIASGFRHAAANFTAFAHAQGTDDPFSTEGIVKSSCDCLNRMKLTTEVKRLQ